MVEKQDLGGQIEGVSIICLEEKVQGRINCYKVYEWLV